ncbi:NTP transferase domain-containing protein [Pseudomonadota bacterium]
MTKALILAAGQGTRLRPLTNDKPKCLVSLAGVSLLERQVKTLESEGVYEIHIATGYRADQIKKMGFSTSFNKNFDKTNMVESLFSAVDFIKNCQEDLIIGYGDIVYNNENLRMLLESDDEIALMIDSNWRELWSLRLENPLDDAETLIKNKDGLVIEIGKKPESYEQIQGQYTGLIKIRKDKIANFIQFYKDLDRQARYDGNDFYNMYMTSFLQMLADSGWRLKCVDVKSGWLEIDSVDDLKQYEGLESKGKLSQFYRLEY